MATQQKKPNQFTNINGQSYYTGANSGIQSNQAAIQDAQKMLGLSQGPTTGSPTFGQSANLGLKPPSNIAPPLAKPDTTMSLADIIRNPNKDQQKQQYETYYDEAMKKGLISQGVTAPNAANFVSQNPNYNPFRPMPTLQESISRGIPTFTDPRTGKVTNLNSRPNYPTIPISVPGGAPVQVSLADAFGPNSPFNSLNGLSIPRNMLEQDGSTGQGFDPEFLQYLLQMLQFMPSLQAQGGGNYGFGGMPQWS